MSVRSTPKPTTSTLGAPATPIQFRDDFVNSSAALAASHDESVRNILSRLDMLQSKVASDGEAAAAVPVTIKTTKPTPGKATPAPLAAESSASSLHSRLSNLETIHQDHLTRLGSQLNAVEDQLIRNSGDNSTIHEISAKFGQIESHLRKQGQLHDRIDTIESQLASLKSAKPTELHSRIRSLESEVASLRASTEPHPDQEGLLRKINARLDEFESAKRTNVRLGARADLESSPASSSNASPDRRQQYLSTRLEKLKELRSRYE